MIAAAVADRDGDGQALADATGIVTVADLRSADVAAGGQGAPLLPIYHAALTAGLPRPLVVLNLGGDVLIDAFEDVEEAIDGLLSDFYVRRALKF